MIRWSVFRVFTARSSLRRLQWWELFLLCRWQMSWPLSSAAERDIPSVSDSPAVTISGSIGRPRKPVSALNCDLNVSIQPPRANSDAGSSSQATRGNYDGLNAIRVIRNSTDGKVYQCLVCQYWCKQKSHIDQHIRIHTGEKPFQCSFCEYRSTTKSNITKHELSKHQTFDHQLFVSKGIPEANT